MLLSKFFPLYVAIRGLFFPLHQDIKLNHFEKAKSCYKIEKVAKLPTQINESSGIQYLSDNKLYDHNDSGSEPTLYLHNFQGVILDSFSLPVKNKDWEDITRDPQGNIYIGDIGNNANKRKDLVIYQFNKELELKGKINFHYPDQYRFPPGDNQMNFDCEALFYHGDSLYLFSKNRGNTIVKLYSLPAKPGDYKAILRDSIQLKGPITGADISPDANQFVLLSYGYTYFFSIRENTINFSHPSHCFYFGRSAQSEGISFINSSDFLISNEQGKLFKIIKKKHP